MRLVTLFVCSMLVVPATVHADPPMQGVTIKSPELFAAGTVLATEGGISVLAGVTTLALAACGGDNSAYVSVGVPLVVLGALSLLGGLGMAFDGGRHVPTHYWNVAPAIGPHGGGVVAVLRF